MRTWMKKTAAVLMIAGLAGMATAQTAKRPEKESREMKQLRHRGEQLRIDRIKLAVKQGFVKNDRATFIIKRIKFMSEFKNSNPQWVKYSRFGRGFHGRRGKGRMGRGCPMMGRRGDRMGRRGDRMGRRGRRGSGRNSDMRRKKRDFWKNLTTETADMKKLRHQRRDLAISRIRFAVKQGFADSDRAAWMIKRIKATHAFKDNNPEWVKYGRGYGRRGSKGMGRGRRGMRGGYRGYRGQGR